MKPFGYKVIYMWQEKFDGGVNERQRGSLVKHERGFKERRRGTRYGVINCGESGGQ